MLKRKDTNPENFDTLIGTNSIFEGNLQCEGTIRIDGKLKGDLKINGDVVVGTNAVVTGSVFANNVYISGTIEGNVNAKGILRLLSTARLLGDINVQSFVSDEGGIFQGKCNMADASKSGSTSEK